MATPQSPQYPELDGAEQHHDLKNDPGKQGDPDHAKESDPSDDAKKSDAD